MEDYGKWEYISKALQVCIYILLPIMTFPEKGGDMEEEGHRCPWLVSYHATHQPCLSRSAQLQGPTVRCRVYLGYCHFMTRSAFFIPRWDERAQSWECSKASTGAGMRLCITKACEDSSKDASEGSAGAQSPPLPTPLYIGPEWREWRMIQFPPRVNPCLGLPDVTDYRRGHLVWSSVCWVWLDSSISFNLSQMDLEPGAEGLNSHYRNPHPAYKPFSQGNQLLAKRIPPPDGLWKLRPYKRTGLKEFILGNWNWYHRISSATYTLEVPQDYGENRNLLPSIWFTRNQIS